MQLIHDLLKLHSFPCTFYLDAKSTKKIKAVWKMLVFLRLWLLRNPSRPEPALPCLSNLALRTSGLLLASPSRTPLRSKSYAFSIRPAVFIALKPCQTQESPANTTITTLITPTTLSTDNLDNRQHLQTCHRQATLTTITTITTLTTLTTTLCGVSIASQRWLYPEMDSFCTNFKKIT